MWVKVYSIKIFYEKEESYLRDNENELGSDVWDEKRYFETYADAEWWIKNKMCKDYKCIIEETYIFK